MGNRAEVHFVDREKHFSPGVYIHSFGHEVPKLLADAMHFFLRHDSEYCAARFCGVTHDFLVAEECRPQYGLGLRPPLNDLVEATEKRAARLDWGLVIVNVSDFSVERFGYAITKEIVLDPTTVKRWPGVKKKRRKKEETK